MDNCKKFYQIVDGELKMLTAKGLTRGLVSYANACISEKLTERKPSNDFDELVKVISYNLLTKYLSESSSEVFAANINEHSKSIKFRHIFAFPKGSQKPELLEVLDMEIGFGTPYLQSLYPFLCAVKSGEIDNLKQCGSDNCKKFFLGRKNQKWCSDKCGSKSRMKKKRERDFKKQIFD